MFVSYAKAVLLGIGGGFLVWLIISIILVFVLPRSWYEIVLNGITIIIPILTIFVIFINCKEAKENFQEIRAKKREEQE